MTEDDFNAQSKEEQKSKRTGDLQQKVSFLPDINRMLPQSSDAEQAILSSFLLAPKEVYSLCMEKGLRADHFHIPAHAIIYSRLCVMSDSATQSIDVITLTQQLRNHNELERAGGPAFVTGLFILLPTAANAAFYLEIILEKFTLREMIRVCTEYAARSYEEQHEVQTLLDECESKILGIASQRFSRPRTGSIKQLTMEAVAAIDKAYERKGEITGLSTGFVDLDRLTDGLHPAEMIVIAARPSMGKTALSMNIADHIAIELKRSVAFFSLEMTGLQLVQRWLLSRARVDFCRVRDGFLHERDFPAITAAANKLASAVVHLDDGSDLSIQEIRARARRMKDTSDIAAVFVDYLQLVRSTTKRAGEKRWIEVGEVSAGLKQMGKELGIPVVVLAQIGRGVESDKRRPRLSDLRESGNIEQDADGVWFLAREEMYAESEEEKREAEGKATVIVAKSRNGPLGDVPLTFIKEHTRFETRSRHEEPEEPQPEFNL